MGSLMHPVGPEAPRVYWVRRVLVLVVLVVVAGLVWWVWPKPGAVSAIPAAQGTQNPTTSAAASVTPAAGGTVSPSAAPTTPAGPQACDPASIRLTVAGFQRLKVTKKQEFTLSAINGGTAPCVLTISPKTYTLTITSGDDRIWSTADCAKWLPEKKLTIEPESAHEFTVTWPLRRSQNGCKTTKGQLKPGTYVAKAVWNEKATARQVMQLVG